MLHYLFISNYKNNKDVHYINNVFFPLIVGLFKRVILARKFEISSNKNQGIIHISE